MDGMARIKGITQGGSLLTRFAFFISRRFSGKGLHPLRVGAPDTRRLLALGHMALAQQRARQPPRAMKHLARMLAGLQVYCPRWSESGVFERRTAGMAEARVRALPAYARSPLFTQDAWILLRSAQAMTQMPCSFPLPSSARSRPAIARDRWSH